MSIDQNPMKIGQQQFNGSHLPMEATEKLHLHATLPFFWLSACVVCQNGIDITHHLNGI